MYEAEKNIMKLFDVRIDHVIAKLEVEIQKELKEEDPNRFRKKINQLENKHANFRKVPEKRRIRNGKGLKQQLKVGFKIA